MTAVCVLLSLRTVMARGGLVLRWNGRAAGKGENILQEQGLKKGRGIGFQLNAITLIGIVVMVTILVAFVGYRAYDELLA